MSASSTDQEIQRIRVEYERREREMPANRYAWNHPEHYFLQCQTSRACIAQLNRAGMFPLTGRRVADIGCGSGQWLLEFAQWDAQTLAGIDLDERRIQRAKTKLPAADLHAGDARSLPWQNESFDLVSQFTLFTSILSTPMKKDIAAEMMRVVKPNGLILWNDFRVDNPRNRNVAGIRASEIRALFPGCTVDLHSVTLAPPLARAIVPLSWAGALMLESLPFLRTHYLGIIRKQS
jgi:SAM-dependent methyltransferase